MEFFPGAFEQEWERRRAMLLYEMQLGQTRQAEWDERRRGGAPLLSDHGAGGFGRARRLGGRWSRDGAGSAGRSMRTRFAALARGSQPAVVKLASYGGGARAAAMMSYTSRGGELAVENERGERVLGRDALAEQRTEWKHLFDNRAASRDLGSFHVSIDTASFSSAIDHQDQLREILRSGFGDRRFVYTARERSDGELYVSGVVVLRDGTGERLTGDRKAAEIVQQRYDDTEAGRDVEARFRFHGYGNGVEWGAARVRELVASSDGEVRDDTGRLIGDATHAGDLVQKEWRKELHSRKGRDVMHLIVSARAGTDASAFEGAVREFLGEQFAGHRYVFAVHDPALDPKEVAEGGKRPHIHAHAIVTMRSETGERIVTSPQVFREWRSLMAEKARECGIDMELTDRREQASAPAYTRNQVRPVSYKGRTEHLGTSSAAQERYDAKRSNIETTATTARSQSYAEAALAAWNEMAERAEYQEIANYAELQIARVQIASRNIAERTEIGLSTLQMAPANAHRTSNIRGMEGEPVPDPVAQAILASGHLHEIETALLDAGLTEAMTAIGGGASSVVLRSGDHVVRLGHWEATARPNIPEVLQSTAYGNIGGVGYEILPVAETSGVTTHDVEQMTALLADRGYDFSDAGADNLGRVGGNLMVIDAGAVTKQPHGCDHESKTDVPVDERIIDVAAASQPSRYAITTTRASSDLTSENTGAPEGKLAMPRNARLEGVADTNQIDSDIGRISQETTKNTSHMIELIEIVSGEDGQMREMTRPEFEAYEKRVEAVLSNVERSVDEVDRAGFEEIAAAAREVVDIRREYLELSERQAGIDEAPHDRQLLGDSGIRKGIAKAEVEAVEAEQGVRATYEGESRVESVKEISPAMAALHQRYFNENLDNAARDKAGAEQLMAHVVESYPKDQLRGDTDLGEVADHYAREHFPNETSARQHEIAARIEEANEIRQGYYSTWRELEAEDAAGDPDELGWQAELAFERQQHEERDAAYNDGFEGRAIPDVVKNNPGLLANYEQGLRALEMEIAVTDAENGIGSVGWGRADGSWTRKDSEAAWENFNRRSSELQAFQVEHGLAAQMRQGPATTPESANDERVPSRGRNDDRAAPPVPDQVTRERDDDHSGQGMQRVPPMITRDGPERAAEISRSDPPQQHVPRLQELEREIEERRERDRDDRER